MRLSVKRVAFAALLLFPFHGGRALRADQSKTIIVFGDSLTAGYGLEPGQSYPSILQKKINERGLKFNVINAGVSGDTTADGAARLNWVLKKPADVFVLALGANDGLRGIPVSQIKKNLQSIIDGVRKRNPKVKVLLVGIKMPPNMGAAYTDQFPAMFKDVADKNKLPLVPFLLEGVGGVEELNQGDRIHPTEEGQKILAENVWKGLRPLLETPKPK